MPNQELQAKLDRLLGFLAQDENNLQLLLDVCGHYKALGDNKLAQHYMDKANAIDREGCLGHQGILFLNQGLLNEAKACFTEALDFFETQTVRYNLCFCLFLLGEFEETKEALTPLLEGEHFPSAELLMARTLHNQGDIEIAIDFAKGVLKYNPQDADALSLLALFYFDLNDEQLAQETAQQAIEIDPTIYEARLVQALIRLPTQETTIEEVESLLSINPRDSRLWFALGNIYMGQGDLESAEHTLENAIELYPDFYDCYISLGWCQLLMDDTEAAEETYQNATKIAPELADAWGGLALVQALTANLWKADLYIEKAHNLHSNCFLAEIAEAICHSQKNPEQCKDHLLKALNNTELGVGKQLAYFMEELENNQQLH